MALRKQALCLVVAVMAACGGSGGSGGPVDGPPPPAADPVAEVTGLRCSGDASSGWCWQAPQPWGHLIRDVTFTSATDGWVVGDGGAMLRTRDGGLSWEERFMPGAPGLQAIRFADARNGWLLGTEGGRLWRTVDGGASWVAAPSLPLDFALSLRLAGSNTLWVRGDVESRSFGGIHLVSDDAGVTWRTMGPLFVGLDADGTAWNFSDDSGLVVSVDAGRTFTRPAAWPVDRKAVSLGRSTDGYAWVTLQPRDPASLAGMSYLQRLGSRAEWTSPSLPVGGGGLGLWLQPGGAWAYGGIYPDGQALWHAAAPGQPWSAVAPPVAGYNSAGYTFVDGTTAWTHEQTAVPTALITADSGASWVRATALGPAGNSSPTLLRRDGGGGLLMSADGLPDWYLGPAAWFRSTDQGRSWSMLPGAHEPTDEFMGLWMRDSQRGLAVSGSGRIVETVDGGRHWTRGTDALVQAARGRPPRFLQFTPGGIGWLLDDDRLHRSADGGRTWEAIDPGIALALRGLQFIDDRRGFLFAGSSCGGPHTYFECGQQLYTSTDGGSSWVPVGEVWTGETGLVMLDARRGVRVRGRLAEFTEDGGLSWRAASSPPEVPSQALRRVTPGAGALWRLHGDALLRSDDGGRDWRSVPLPVKLPPAPIILGYTPTTLQDLHFTGQHGWIVGTQGLVLASTDGGRSWVRQASGTGMDLQRVFALGPRAVWIAGAYGSILASATGGR